MLRLAVGYREEHPGELCARCGELAKEFCPRCGQTYCSAHAPADRRRCDPCESAYLVRETRLTRQLMVSVVLSAGLVALLGAFAIHAARNGYITGPSAHLVPLILYAALFVLAASFASTPLVRRLIRRRFLGERRRTQ